MKISTQHLAHVSLEDAKKMILGATAHKIDPSIAITEFVVTYDGRRKQFTISASLERDGDEFPGFMPDALDFEAPSLNESDYERCWEVEHDRFSDLGTSSMRPHEGSIVLLEKRNGETEAVTVSHYSDDLVFVTRSPADIKKAKYLFKVSNHDGPDQDDVICEVEYIHWNRDDENE